MTVLRESAGAKINLYLHVTGKRGDGYHLLDSLVAFGDYGDLLEVRPAQALSLTMEGPFADGLTLEDNSVLKAARVLQAACGVSTGAAFTLHKRLPIAAGIGGGSADAAASLRLLMRLWKAALPPDALQALALALGADVPACLRSASLYMGGIGESVEAGPAFHGLRAVLVNPLIPLPTKDVFALYRPPFGAAVPHPSRFASQEQCLEYLAQTRNDLEPAACRKLPELETVLAALGRQACCLKPRMSGSGATCFALFSSHASAEKAAAAIQAEHPGWWVKEMAIG